MGSLHNAFVAWSCASKGGSQLSGCQIATSRECFCDFGRKLEKIEILIKTFFNRLKGYHVQYNVVSKETLLDAQAHPEKHKDLIVRVAGYSAFFNVLSKATQDDIIGRTEQTL